MALDRTTLPGPKLALLWLMRIADAAYSADSIIDGRQFTDEQDNYSTGGRGLSTA
jgi:hypothetical protein